MKKTLAMLLSVVLCFGMFMGCAQADSPSHLVGYWEAANFAINGRTYGAEHNGVDITAIVHNDGVLITLQDNDMTADYINGYGDNCYLGEGDDAIDVTYDSQGRLHLTYYDDDDDLIDIRFRRATAPKIDSRMRAYVGDWKLTAQDEAIYGELNMSLYNDGFGIIYGGNTLFAVRLSMRAGKVCLVDNEGLIMPITQGSNGSIVFTIVYTNTTDEDTLHMERVY